MRMHLIWTFRNVLFKFDLWKILELWLHNQAFSRIFLVWCKPVLRFLCLCEHNLVRRMNYNLSIIPNLNSDRAFSRAPVTIRTYVPTFFSKVNSFFPYVDCWISRTGTDRVEPHLGRSLSAILPYSQHNAGYHRPMCGHVAGPSRCPAPAYHPGQSLLSSCGRRGRRLLLWRQRATPLPCYHAVPRVRLAHPRDAGGPADCAAGQATTQSPKSGFQCRQWFGRCDRSVGPDTAVWRKHHSAAHLSHRHHHRMLDTSHGALHAFRLLARFPAVQPTASARDSAVLVNTDDPGPNYLHTSSAAVATRGQVAHRLMSVLMAHGCLPRLDWIV